MPTYIVNTVAALFFVLGIVDGLALAQLKDIPAFASELVLALNATAIGIYVFYVAHEHPLKWGLIPLCLAGPIWLVFAIVSKVPFPH